MSIISNTSRTLYIFFAIGVLGWVTVYSSIAPRGLAEDNFVYKDPAVSWALGEGLVTVTTHPNPTLTPKLNELPPIYTLLFAGYTRLVGIGDMQNTYFDLLLYILRTFLCFELLVMRWLAQATWWQRVMMTGLMLIWLPFASNYDRPEELSAILALLSLFIYTETAYRYRLGVAFLLAGINLTNLVFGGLMNLAFLCAIFTLEKSLKHGRFFPNLNEFFQIMLGYLVPLVVAVTAMVMQDSDAMARYFAASSDPYNFWLFNKESDTLSRALSTHNITQLIQIGLFYGVNGFVFWELGSVYWHNTNKRVRLGIGIFSFGIVTVLGLVVLIAPFKMYYMFLASYTLWVFFVYAQQLLGVQFVRVEAVARWCNVALVLVTLPRVAGDVYVRAFQHDAYHESREAAKVICKNLDPNEFLLLSGKSYFLFKPYHHRIGHIKNWLEDLDNAAHFVVQYKESHIQTDPRILRLLSDSRVTCDYTPRVEPQAPSMLESRALRSVGFWEIQYYILTK
jgi:hypothetical protein